MTDETDDRDDNRMDAPTADATSAVPEDADWDLALQVPFDEDGDHDLTSSIVLAISEAEGVPPMDVKEPPLYEVLDVAALEAAFFGSDTVGQSSSGHHSVEFMYRSHRVVVRSDAWVQVYDPKEP